MYLCMCTHMVSLISQGKQKSSVMSDFAGAWDGERERGVRILQQLVRLPLARLWEPPIVEEDFVK